MSVIFPEAPFIPAARQGTIPVCEWVVPAAVRQRRRYLEPSAELPPGMPDRLLVDTRYSRSGIERSTAAFYRGRAYLIHYTFALPEPAVAA